MYAIITLVTWGVWGAFSEVPGCPSTMVYVVWALSMVPCMILALWLGGWKVAHDRRSIVSGALVGLLGSGGQLLLFAALKEGPAYIVFPFISMSPIVTVLMSMLILKEKASKTQWFGIVVALVAIFFLSWQDPTDTNVKGYTWLILATLVFLMWGVQGFFFKTANTSMPSESVYFYQTVWSLVLIPVALFMTEGGKEAIMIPSSVFWSVFGIQILNAIGALTINYAYRYGKAIIVSPMQGLAPVVTIIISLVLYGKIPGEMLLIGLVLATMAILSLSLEPAKTQKGERKRITWMALLTLAAIATVFFFESRTKSEVVEEESSAVTSYTFPNVHPTVEVDQPRKGLTPKNVIFMIGDGMGLEQLSAAWIANRGDLNIDQMPYVGLQRTYCLDWVVTDSAAAGTALATGQKTNKGMVATTPDGVELNSMMDTAQRMGKRTGVVVVCRLNDATPATFCCNNPDRDEAEDITADYLTCGVDFIAGGGMNYWRDERTDGRDIFAEIGAKGYNTYESVEALMEAEELPVAAVVAPLELPSALSGERGDKFRNMVSKSIEMLDEKNDEGFFLMVEASCIDDWLHANRVDAAVEEILDFDRVVGDVLEWAEEDGETLVVVTADHATGAMTIQWGDIETGTVEVDFANQGHNGIMVPFFAYGAGAERFDGTVENNELSKMISALIK